MYTTSVICLLSGILGSMVCGEDVGGMWREVVCGNKCYVGETAWEVNGMFEVSGIIDVSVIIDVSGM